MILLTREFQGICIPCLSKYANALKWDQQTDKGEVIPMCEPVYAGDTKTGT